MTQMGTNGVIHGIDSILVPPPQALDIIQFLPSEFSTLELGLLKTGLLEGLNKTAHAGLTFFAPNNFAFQKLGPRINGFLFSPYGQKYLKAVLQYHVVLNQTLYSDAYYKTAGSDSSNDDDHRHDGPGHVPKGYFQVDLPTLLEDRSLNVYIARYGRLIAIKINGFANVVVEDGVAKDGVVHVVGDVLIPPKKLGMDNKPDVGTADMTLEEFIERLEPYVEKGEKNGKLDL